LSEKLERMNMVDAGTFEDSAIIRDDDQYLVVKSVLASEIVQPYRDQKTGKTFYAYKPADELEKAVLTFRGVPIKVLSHPKGSHIEDAEDDNGRVENPIFRKDLIDPKTNRPCRRGIVGELCFYRDNSPEAKTGNYTPITEAIAESIRKGTLKDNSIGFSCHNHLTSGEWQGQHYDVVQRKIRGNHVAAPIEKGRCASPLCGIGMDSADEVDTWEITEENIRSGHGDKNSFDPDSFRTIDITDGIKAVVGCPKGSYADGKCTVGMETQSFLFDKSKFDMEKAKAWFAKHQKDSSENLKAFYDCPVCKKIDELGVLETGKRLIKVYSAADALLALSDAPPTDKELQAERSSKYGIAVKEGGNVSKPTEYSNIPDGEFADPVNYRYPIDEAHVVAAWAYWNKPANQTEYNAEEKTKITDKIETAMKKHGHEIAGQKPQDSEDDTAQLISRVNGLVKELGVLFP
jgi:hypothetical protein